MARGKGPPIAMIWGLSMKASSGFGWPVSLNVFLSPRTQRLKISRFRKILVSVTFLSAILGQEMGASTLWTPGKCALSARKKPMSIKFLVLGGGIGFWGGGGSADFIFMGARIFLKDCTPGLKFSSGIENFKRATHQTQFLREF